MIKLAVKHIRRLIIAVVGFTLLAVGAALLVLPGPGLLVIALALAILATEFIWARRLLKKFGDVFRKKNRPDEPGV